MVILIAESKTMLTAEKPVSAHQLATSTPLYSETVADIMESLRSLPLAELASQLKLSMSLAAKMQKMIYEFPFKLTGNTAIEAFTGVVFKALDYASLSPDAKDRCEAHVRIISSLYGWLRPLDVIKPYRLDFTSRLDEGPSEGKTLNAFWRMDVTKALVKTLNDGHETEIINLLPGDAAKCIDWKLVKRFAKVWKVDFQEIREGDVLKTPTAERLKALRGSLLRQILTDGISRASDLLHTSSDRYVCEGTPVYPDHFRFLC